MLKRFGHVLLIVALVAATGGHWAVLQTVAWTTMLADNLRTSSFSEAVERTFDGKRPCSLCKSISAGKKEEKKSEFPAWLKKLEFVSQRPVVVFSAPQSFYLLAERTDSVGEIAHQPPSPPPRRFAV